MAVSEDGSLIVGKRFTESFEWEDFVWTESDGLARLPEGEDGTRAVNAGAATPDGRVIAGALHPHYTLYRWTGDAGYEDTGVPASDATGISDDGKVILARRGPFPGESSDAIYCYYAWISPGDVVQIGCSGTSGSTIPHAISGDGSVVVGAGYATQSPSKTSARSLRWYADSGFEREETIEGLAVALGVSADGSVVVGYETYTFDRRGDAAYVTNGIVTNIAEAFASEVGGGDLGQAIDVSADGRVILGDRWILDLPEPTSALLEGSALAVLVGLVRSRRAC